MRTGFDEAAVSGWDFLKPVAELKAEQFTEQAPNADTGKEIAVTADLTGIAFVIPFGRMVKRQFHESSEGHRSLCRDFLTDYLFELAHKTRQTVGKCSRGSAL
jgi:hypothetical protein